MMLSELGQEPKAWEGKQVNGNGRPTRGGRLLMTLFFWGVASWAYGQLTQISGTVTDQDRKPLPGVLVGIAELGKGDATDQKGAFRFWVRLEEGQRYVLEAKFIGYQVHQQEIKASQAQQTLQITLLPDGGETPEVTVEGYREVQSAFLRDVDMKNGTIYAAKKTERIRVPDLTACLATNNPRQLYKRIPGVNIWESDGAGLQLGIGARGLDPNRTSNFNVRQNGYDISADALGYPESYYTPPAEAIETIEVVRGAASLQYGTQFGGLVNFALKDGPDSTPLAITTRQTIGSFGLINSFNSIGGQKESLRYYAYYHRRQGDGWRPNGGFGMNNAYATLGWQPHSSIQIKAEFTHMDYQAQQPGGLTDWQFESQPALSTRERNWFAVNWNLPALTLNWELGLRTTLNARTFALFASRQALGYLKRINTQDPLGNRTLMRDQYQNVGSEIRLMHRYQLLGQDAVLLLGTRLYRGETHRQQGDGNDGYGADFEFLNPQNLENSNYRFPNHNASLFAEQLFGLGKRWTITPGARFEYIRTQANGYFNQHILNFSGDTVQSIRFDESLTNERAFVLVGVGISYRPAEGIEVYGNFSQNYRSVTFSDLRRVNLSIEIDSAIRDESGYNVDIGIRGELDQWLTYDVSLFYLRYRDRIGQLFRSSPPPVFRTNIADAYTHGLELFLEADLWRLAAPQPRQTKSLKVFVNASLIQGRYLGGETDVSGNAVELVPPMTLRTGFQLRLGAFRASWQFNQVAEHYTDATNAVDAPSSEIGLIPAYHVMDITASYQFKSFQLEAGINNLGNTKYFTRRATGYPGPGIIPADIRNFFVTIQWKINPLKN